MLFDLIRGLLNLQEYLGSRNGFCLYSNELLIEFSMYQHEVWLLAKLGVLLKVWLFEILVIKTEFPPLIFENVY